MVRLFFCESCTQKLNWIKDLYQQQQTHADCKKINIEFVTCTFCILVSRGQIKGGLSYSFVATRLITCCLSSVCLYISFQTFHILPFIYRMTKLRKPNLYENILRLREIKIAYSNHFKREIVLKNIFYESY